MNCRMCEIVSDTEHLTEQKIREVIAEHECIDKWLYILHDKDMKEDGTPKSPHHHTYLHFLSPQDSKYIAKWFGIGENFIAKIKGRFGDAVEYAQHKNAPDKYQYPDSAVKANFDFIKVQEHNEKTKEKKATIADIIARIDRGEIKPYNITDVISMDDYCKFNRQIKQAFEYRTKRLEREVNRIMDVVYIYGASGTGKTTYAKMMAESKNYEVFMSSGSNDPFDGYKGQECVILDDLRGSVFPLADLLKILDNNTASSVKARYKNICLECKLLIITTTKTMSEFYKQVFESNGEEFKQFSRRCGSVCRMTKESMEIFVYDDEKENYVRMTSIPNPVQAKLKLDALKQQKKREHCLALFGIVADTAKGLSEAVGNMSEEQFETLLDESEYDDNGKNG